MTLDDLATKLVERRAFFSLCFVEKTGKWQANLRSEGSSGWKCATEDTVEAAVAAALAPPPVFVETPTEDLFA